MTDPIDHEERVKEIEARVDARDEDAVPVDDAERDLRYLLGRVRELEAARTELFTTIEKWRWNSDWPVSAAFDDVLEEIDRLLPAPETMETQG